jgi:hypothetical protein
VRARCLFLRGDVGLVGDRHEIHGDRARRSRSPVARAPAMPRPRRRAGPRGASPRASAAPHSGSDFAGPTAAACLCHGAGLSQDRIRRKPATFSSPITFITAP